jgi:hypothetical protein
MKRVTLVMAALSLLVGGVGQAKADMIYPVNNGFEVPNLGSGILAYGYGPDAAALGAIALPSSSGVGWTFTGTTGIAANGSEFAVSGATNGNHDGTNSTSGQAAFIQALNGTFHFPVNSISQTLSGFVAGSASVTFSIEQRGSTGGGNNPIDVKLDGQDLGTYLASSSSSFNTITTPFVSVTAGSHTISFTGTNSSTDLNSDNTEFIDNVSVNNVSVDSAPEPASLTLLGIAAASGLGYSAWRRRKLTA